MRCVFVNIRCKPGTSYAVAEQIALREIHSELYSTSGPFDLLLKLYIERQRRCGPFHQRKAARYRRDRADRDNADLQGVLNIKGDGV